MIKYELFSELYDQALKYNDCDKYIAECSMQDWTDEIEGGSVLPDVLTFIFIFSHMTLKEMRATLKLTFNAFSKIYSVPSRTVQDWEYEKSKTPMYMKKLVAYTMLVDNFLDK